MTPTASMKSIAAAVLLAMASLISITRAKAQTVPCVGETQNTCYDVTIVIEGPWAIADDPASAGKIALIAPDSELIDHFKPAVRHRHGTQELDFTTTLVINNIAHIQQCSACPGISLKSVNVDKNKLRSLFTATSGRYLISLPAPDYYEEKVGQESRLRDTWWDKCLPNCKASSQQQSWTTNVILHYGVTRLGGLWLNGKPLDFADSGTLDIFMDPNDIMDGCDSGGRLAFKGLIGLFSLTNPKLLYLDLPDESSGAYPSDDKLALTTVGSCLNDDPQNPANSGSAGSVSDALNSLEDYVHDPTPEAVRQARANWTLIQSAPHRVPKGTKDTYRADIQNIDEFLKKIESRQTPDTSSTMQALDGLHRLRRRFIPFHNGSGACRNPLLKIIPM